MLCPGTPPFPVCVRPAQGEGGLALLQIKREAVGLPLHGAIIPPIGQHTHVEDGDGLHRFVSDRKSSGPQEIIARLLDEGLEFDQAPAIAL